MRSGSNGHSNNHSSSHRHSGGDSKSPGVKGPNNSVNRSFSINRSVSNGSDARTEGRGSPYLAPSSSSSSRGAKGQNGRKEITDVRGEGRDNDSLKERERGRERDSDRETGKERERERGSSSSPRAVSVIDIIPEYEVSCGTNSSD